MYGTVYALIFMLIDLATVAVLGANIQFSVMASLARGSSIGSNGILKCMKFWSTFSYGFLGPRQGYTDGIVVSLRSGVGGHQVHIDDQVLWPNGKKNAIFAKKFPHFVKNRQKSLLSLKEWSQNGAVFEKGVRVGVYSLFLGFTGKNQ